MIEVIFFDNKTLISSNFGKILNILTISVHLILTLSYLMISI